MSSLDDNLVPIALACYFNVKGRFGQNNDCVNNKHTLMLT